MYGQLTYHDERLKGFDPVDLFFHVLGCILDLVGVEGAIELLFEALFCFLELL
jgi:hypothetical protein